MIASYDAMIDLVTNPEKIIKNDKKPCGEQCFLIKESGNEEVNILLSLV